MDNNATAILIIVAGYNGRERIGHGVAALP